MVDHNKLTKEEMKEAVVLGITTWLDRQYTILGRWTARLIIMAFICALLYFITVFKGWDILKSH